MCDHLSKVETVVFMGLCKSYAQGEEFVYSRGVSQLRMILILRIILQISPAPHCLRVQFNHKTSHYL